MSSSRSPETPSNFQCVDHDKKLLEYADKKRKHGTYNDVTITAGTQSILANKMVFSCYSKFFETKFETNLKKRSLRKELEEKEYQNEVEVNGFDGHIIKQLVDYIYTGTITIDTDNVMSFLAASNYLLLDAVKEFCFEHLNTVLTTENCLNIITATFLYNPNASWRTAYKLMSENLEEISQTDNFKALGKPDLISIMKELDKSETNEKAKYQAIINWVKSDEETRGKDFPDLFQLIDITDLPIACLEDVSTESLVQQHSHCLEGVLARTNLLKETTLREAAAPRILCVGGNRSDAVFELPNLFGETNKTYPNLPNGVSFHGAAKVNNFIYCIGGQITGESHTKQVFQMNLNEHVLTWREVATLNEARSAFGCAVFNGKLVVTGGSGAEKSTELYEERSNTWRTISSLNEGSLGNALVTCEGHLYSIGGMLFTPSVIRLSDFDGIWEKVNSMKKCRSYLAAVNCKGFIYAIGGRYVGIRNCVEKYIPNENKWINVEPMNIARCRHAACVVQDKIYVVGGKNAENKFVHEIECYDPISDTWGIVGEIDLGGHALIVV